MKLVRIGNSGEERPAILVNDQYYHVSNHVNDFDEQFFSDPKNLEELEKALANEELERVVPTRIGPPIGKPGKIICIGLNYSKHAAESGMQVPDEPLIFFKAPSAVIGPYDDVVIPKNSTKTDWEVELAVVIGKKASYVEEDEAMNHVAGYVLHNDISERDFQLNRGGQWVKGKSSDTFAPIGPYIATKEEIPDPHNLRLWCKVNGEMLQDDSTSDLIFRIPKLISYLSQFMSLLPGDIISTGTPSGVGLGLNPPRFLRPNDTVELGIDGLGTAKHNVKPYELA